MDTCKDCQHFELQSKPKCHLFVIDLEEKTNPPQNTPIGPGQPDVKPNDMCCDDFEKKD